MRSAPAASATPEAPSAHAAPPQARSYAGEASPSGSAPEATISGRVIDALGGPVPGAVVDALGEHSREPIASTVTASDGAFELRTPPGSLRVVARASGYSTEQRHALAPTTELTLSLAPATRIFGRVTDAANAPVPGAMVHARPMRRLGSFDPSVITDTAGNFRFEALSAGEYELRATGDRLSGEPVRVASNVAEEVGPVDLRVTSAVRVALDVERDGRACAGGWVQLSGTRFQGAREIAEGRVLFDAVPRGVYSLSLGCEQAAFQSRELSVGDADIARTIQLDPGQALAGRVLDVGGLGVAGVLVTASPTGDPGGRAQMTCRSDANGDFLCEGLGPGAYHCHAGLELQPQSDPVHVRLIEGVAPPLLELRLHPRAAVVVSLEQAPAERLSTIRVTARPEQGPPLEAERRGSEFHFDGLLLGSYAVSLAASPGTRRDVVLEHDGQRVDVSLPWPSTRSISGVALDEQRQPAVEVWVHAAAEGGFLPLAAVAEAGLPALTDAAGRFTIEGLFEGRYNLRVEAPQREGFARGVSSGATDVVIHVASRPEANLGNDSNELDRATH